jgi:hypothetical protein
MIAVIRILCTITLLLAATSIGYAALTLREQVARDFGPIPGYVVKVHDDELLIDLDSGQGVAVGDLFSVVGPGEAITHPVTGKVLGREDRLKGILRLTSVRIGYSHGRSVWTADDIKGGDAIRRFQDMAALFWDYTGKGEGVARELQGALPRLQWSGYAASQQSRPATPGRTDVASPTLYFILTIQGLEVRAPDFELIRSYPVDSMPVAAIPSARQSVPGPSSPTAAQQTVAAAGTAGEALWSSLPFEGTPVGIEAGDLDGDGRQEVAVAFADRLDVGRLGAAGYEPLETIRFAAGSHAYALDGADLDANGRLELYVAAMNSNGNPAGASIEFRDGSFRITRSGIPWHLRSVALPGEGEVLLGQAYDSMGHEFAGPVFRVRSVDGRLVAGEALPLPRQVSLYGFAAFASQGRTLFACLDDDGYLAILTPSGELLATSVDKVGGSESWFTMNNEVGSGGESRHVHLKARVEANEQGDILVAANSGLGFLERFRMYVRSEIKRLHWNGKALRETWHTVPDKSYLADFTVLKGRAGEADRLLAAVAFPSTSPIKARKATIRLYEVAAP